MIGASVFSNLFLTLTRPPLKWYEAWMEIIKSSYPEGVVVPTTKPVVCDLHFDVNDISKRGVRTMLANNALPTIL